MQQTQRHVRPTEQAEVWTFACAGVLGVAQGGDDLVGEPFAQGSVFGAVVVDEEGVDAGFADQQGVFDLIVDQGFAGLVLVGVEFSQHAFVEVDVQQAAQVSGAEPGLVLDEESVEGEFVAGEDARCQVVFVHGSVLEFK
jgi:hypothetical protein